MLVSFTGLQVRIRPSLHAFYPLVGAVRVHLAFQTDGAALRIGYAALSDHGTVKEITRVNLQTGLVGVNFKHNARYRRNDACGNLFNITIRVQNPVVIIAVCILYLLKNYSRVILLIKAVEVVM